MHIMRIVRNPELSAASIRPDKCNLAQLGTICSLKTRLIDSGSFVRRLFAAGIERSKLACSNTLVAACATAAHAARLRAIVTALSMPRRSSDKRAIKKSRAGPRRTFGRRQICNDARVEYRERTSLE